MQAAVQTDVVHCLSLQVQQEEVEFAAVEVVVEAAVATAALQLEAVGDQCLQVEEEVVVAAEVVVVVVVVAVVVAAAAARIENTAAYYCSGLVLLAACADFAVLTIPAQMTASIADGYAHCSAFHDVIPGNIVGLLAAVLVLLDLPLAGVHFVPMLWLRQLFVHNLLGGLASGDAKRHGLGSVLSSISHLEHKCQQERAEYETKSPPTLHCHHQYRGPLLLLSIVVGVEKCNQLLADPTQKNERHQFLFYRQNMPQSWHCGPTLCVAHPDGVQSCRKIAVFERLRV